MVTQLFGNFIWVGNEVISSVDVAVALLELCVGNQNIFNNTHTHTHTHTHAHTHTHYAHVLYKHKDSTRDSQYYNTYIVVSSYDLIKNIRKYLPSRVLTSFMSFDMHSINISLIWAVVGTLILELILPRTSRRRNTRLYSIYLMQLVKINIINVFHSNKAFTDLNTKSTW